MAQFWVIFLGSIIFYMSIAIVLNSIITVANLWFADDERGKSAAISGLMVPLGNLVGLGITGVLSAGVDNEDPVDCMNRFKKITYI